jgi:hypothetical protein
LGVVERALELGFDDRIDGRGFVSAGVAGRLLAFGIGPAGTVGDRLAVVTDEQPADHTCRSAWS